jgi:hypothetical protein
MNILAYILPVMSRSSVELVTYSEFPPSPSSQSLNNHESSAPSQQNGSIGAELAPVASTHEDVSKGTTTVVIASVTCITAIGTLLSGLVTVGLPTMAKDLGLEQSLLLWYVR